MAASDHSLSFVGRALSRLRFPQLFLVLLILFLLDLFMPDPLPLIDEAILAVLTLMVGQWKREPPRAGGRAGKPPEKNVTPRD
jgi:hypothetical protein